MLRASVASITGIITTLGQGLGVGLGQGLGVGLVLAVAASPAAIAAELEGVDPTDGRDPVTGIRTAPTMAAGVFADGIGLVRHMVAADNGWLYGALYRPQDGMGVVSLHDDDGDGTADQIRYFGSGISGTGLALWGGYLYYGTDTSVLRFSLADGPIPTAAPEMVVSGFIRQRSHAAKSIAISEAGDLYVNIGAPSNACMQKSRTPGSPGLQPCPQLEQQSGIWKFSADAAGQVFGEAGTHYTRGVRNAVALDYNEASGALYLVQHGRDQLASFFPEYFDEAASAELPAEEFHRVSEGYDAGWPYSYFDHRVGERMVMPEYGGDGKSVSDSGEKPLLGFPGHWAPNDLLFLNGAGWPAGYDGAALIGFHGSWNRSPVQQGYRVVLVPMKDGGLAGDWITVMDGFQGDGPVKTSNAAEHRPMGLAQDGAGHLYVSSLMSGGRIWQIRRAQ